MGKTYRHPQSTYDDDKRSGRRDKPRSHSNNRKTGGMRIINDIYGDEDDYLDDDVQVRDVIELNKTSGTST